MAMGTACGVLCAMLVLVPAMGAAQTQSILVLPEAAEPARSDDARRASRVGVLPRRSAIQADQTDRSAAGFLLVVPAGAGAGAAIGALWKR